MLENKVFDPDEGLELQDEIEETLLHSIDAIRRGEPTFDAGKVAEKPGLNW